MYSKKGKGMSMDPTATPARKGNVNPGGRVKGSPFPRPTAKGLNSDNTPHGVFLDYKVKKKA